MHWHGGRADEAWRYLPLLRGSDSDLGVWKQDSSWSIKRLLPEQPGYGLDFSWRSNACSSATVCVTLPGADSPCVIQSPGASSTGLSPGSVLWRGMPVLQSRQDGEVKLLETAVLRYSVRFDDHFDWGSGGALPGLFATCGSAKECFRGQWRWLYDGELKVDLRSNGESASPTSEWHHVLRAAAGSWYVLQLSAMFMNGELAVDGWCNGTWVCHMSLPIPGGLVVAPCLTGALLAVHYAGGKSGCQPKRCQKVMFAGVRFWGDIPAKKQKSAALTPDACSEA
eukprot:6468719-Amphidinium_carterae.1